LLVRYRSVPQHLIRCFPVDVTMVHGRTEWQARPSHSRPTAVSRTIFPVSCSGWLSRFAPFLDGGFCSLLCQSRLLLYIITTKACDTITSSRRGTPLIGKSSKAFNRLVLTHNLGLAAYSFWTFIDISAALKGSLWAAYFQNGWSGVSEAMCYIHSQQVLRDPNSLNDKTQATTTGALWDDGLGFYGFWFYVSKYYEVVDSLILFLKGKEISALQIYHHAGAILCVWAGIRYQAPPIWTFVFLNSAVHTLMVRLRAGMFASF